MATMNAAVQQMIDRLHAALSAGTASAEDQLLIGKALQALQSSTTWERALIAVAEEHLNTGTTALSSARALLDAAKVTLDSSSTALNAQAANLALVPQMNETLLNSKTKFFFSSSNLDVRLSSPSETNVNLPRTVWSLSLDDYETGVFTALSASHEPSGGSASNLFVQISANGIVTNSLTALQVSAGTAALLPTTGGSVRLFNLNSGMTVCQVFAPNGVTSVYSFNLNIPRLYLDPATRMVYAANNGKLIQATTEGSTDVVPAVSIPDIATMDAYCQGRGWLRADHRFGAVLNDSLSYMNTVDSQNIATSTTEVSLHIGSYSTNGRTAYLSFDPSKEGHLKFGRTMFNQAEVGHAVVDNHGASASYFSTRSVHFDIRVVGADSKHRLYDITVKPRQDATHAGRGNQVLSPTLIAVSLIHNAAILRGGFVESSHGSARTFTGLAFGR